MPINLPATMMGGAGVGPASLGAGGMNLGLAMLGGSLLGGIFGHSANQTQVAIANRSYDWNKYVTENAHQIEVRDLLKAGLNPMLSFRGSGAPAGNTGGIPSQQNVGMAISSAATAALEREAIKASIAKTTAEATAAQAQAGLTDAQREQLEGYGGREAETRIGLGSAQAAEAEQRTANLKAEIPRIGAEIKNLDNRAEQSFYETNKIITENRLANLDVKQKAAVMPAIVAMLNNDWRKSNLSLPAWENANEAQTVWWRKMLAAMGFTTGEQDALMKAAITGATTRQPK